MTYVPPDGGRRLGPFSGPCRRILMIEHKRFGPLTLILFVLLCASTAFAAPVCVDGSFSAYAPLTSGDPAITCQYQDLIFSFAYNSLIYQKDPSQAPLAPGDRIENHVTITFV